MTLVNRFKHMRPHGNLLTFYGFEHRDGGFYLELDGITVGITHRFSALSLQDLHGCSHLTPIPVQFDVESALYDLSFFGWIDKAIEAFIAYAKEK